MVTVKNYLKRTSKDGEEFLVLELQGGVTPVQSQETGRMYFTAKTCTVPCTFDEDTAQDLIGMEFPGDIVRVECDEYEFTIPETGEIISLSSRWEYQDPSIGIPEKEEELVIHSNAVL